MNTADVTIMVVDDDDDVRASVTSVLVDEGYRVVEAVNGLDALTRAKEAPPDLILLDLMMPLMDGWAFRAEQLDDPAIAAIPVIVFTANPRTDLAPLAPTAVLRKPADINELLVTVARIAFPDP